MYVCVCVCISGTALSKSAVLWYKHTRGFLKAALGSSCFGLVLFLLFVEALFGPLFTLFWNPFTFVFQNNQVRALFCNRFFLAFSKTQARAVFCNRFFFAFSKTQVRALFWNPFFFAFSSPDSVAVWLL